MPRMVVLINKQSSDLHILPLKEGIRLAIAIQTTNSNNISQPIDSTFPSVFN